MIGIAKIYYIILIYILYARKYKKNIIKISRQKNNNRYSYYYIV